MKTLWETFFKDLPLRRKLVLAFLAVSILTGMSLIFLSNWAMRGILNLMVGAEVHNLATAKALAVGNRLGRQMDVLRALSLNHIMRTRLQEANGGYPGDAAAIQAELSDRDRQWITGGDGDPLIQAVLHNPVATELQLFQRNFPSHAEVFLIDRYGGLVAATKRTEDYYQADEAWWVKAAAQEAGDTYIDTLAWDSSSASLGVRIVVPVLAQDGVTRLGMLVSIYRLDILYQLISVTAEDQPGLETRLLLPDGQVLAGEGQTVTPLDPGVQRRLQAIKASYVIQPFEGVERFISLASVATMADEAVIRNLGWRVLVYQDRQAALAPLAAQQAINLGVTAAAIVVSALVGTWMAYGLSRPILRLTETAQRIVAGDMRAVAPVTGGDEIGTLAATFNQMTAQWFETLMKQRASETRFRQYVEAAPDGIFETDAQGCLMMVNPAGCRMIEYTEAELLGRSIHNLITPAILGDGMERFRPLLQNGRISEEITFLKKDGTPVQVLFEAVRLSAARYMAFCKDVTERQRAAAALQDSEMRLNKAQQIARLGSWQLDLTTNKLIWSDEVYRIFEVDPQVSSASFPVFVSIIHPDDLEMANAAYLHSRETQTPYEITHRLRMADGRIKFVHAQGETIYDAAGQPLRSVGVVQDITERKLAEAERERLLQQLEESAGRIHQIMNTVPEGVLLLDADLRVQLCNPAAQLYLQTLAASAQTDGEILTHLGDYPIAELLTSPQNLWHTVIVNRQYFQAIARPMEIGPARMGWVLVIRDTTSAHEMQERLERQERLAVVGQLAAGIAHDFNNILAGIVLYSQMSLRMPDLSSKLRERLTVIAEQSRRAADLINQILDFSRRAVLERQPLDLTPLLKEQVKLWERTLPETIHITLTEGEGDATVNADPTRIQQVLMNLVVNARDAMPNGGHLRVGLAHLQVTETQPGPFPELSVGAWIQVTVSDTGTGIPDDVLPHIFEPFYTTKEPGKGTGLGLAQVYGIIKAHDGHIGVQTQLGVGTTLAFYLPALLSEPLPVFPQKVELRMGHGEIVLVVEDNATTRGAVVESLELLHYLVLEAADGAAALELFAHRQAEIALVLTDMVMPELGGKALAQALHQIAPDLPIVLMSGHPLEHEDDILSTAGMRAWIQKPPDLAQLGETLAQVLSQR